MNLKLRNLTKLTVIALSLLSIFVIGIAPSHAAAPATSMISNIGANITAGSATSTESRLQIPSIDLDVRVVVAPFTGHTWDFSRFNHVAGYFQGLPMPGDGSNAIIGAHSELDKRAPGPFYNLEQVQIGDQIFVTRKGITYAYTVTGTWHVPPTDISPIRGTDSDVLTLLTCAGYDSGIYTTRLVVRAELNIN